MLPVVYERRARHPLLTYHSLAGNSQSLQKDLPPLYYRLLRGDSTEEQLRENPTAPSLRLQLPAVSEDGLSKKVRPPKS
jgi:hypothetical protein